jgi:aspartate/methionine/tyrosine aminotransferase
VIKNDLLVISDEVYEYFTFSKIKHQRIANLPGMFERTLTVCSAGKSFSVTGKFFKFFHDSLGWKIGWIIGPKVHKNLLISRN